MPYQLGHNPNRATAHELFMGSYEDFKNKFYEVLYGDREWRNIIMPSQVDTSINPGATSTSYGVIDRRGRAGFRGRLDNSVPTVEVQRDKNIVPIAVAGVAATFDREDARQLQFGFNARLITDLSEAMKEACEDHMEGVIMYGDEAVNFRPYLDYTGTPTATAANGASGTATWSTKTSDEIVFDVNDAISTVWIDSEFIHMPGTVRLPGEQYALISSLRMSDASDKSVMEYLRTNNIYTSRTGKELNIMPLRYLDNVGAGATARMIVEEENERNALLPMPLPFDLLEPEPRGFGVELYAEYKFGSYHMRFPNSRRYIDGI